MKQDKGNIIYRSWRLIIPIFAKLPKESKSKTVQMIQSPNIPFEFVIFERIISFFRNIPSLGDFLYYNFIVKPKALYDKIFLGLLGYKTLIEERQIWITPKDVKNLESIKKMFVFINRKIENTSDENILDIQNKISKSVEIIDAILKIVVEEKEKTKRLEAALVSMSSEAVLDHIKKHESPE